MGGRRDGTKDHRPDLSSPHENRLKDSGKGKNAGVNLRNRVAERKKKLGGGYWRRKGGGPSDGLAPLLCTKDESGRGYLKVAELQGQNLTKEDIVSWKARRT